MSTTVNSSAHHRVAPGRQPAERERREAVACATVEICFDVPDPSEPPDEAVAT